MVTYIPYLFHHKVVCVPWTVGVSCVFNIIIYKFAVNGSTLQLEFMISNEKQKSFAVHVCADYYRVGHSPFLYNIMNSWL